MSEEKSYNVLTTENGVPIKAWTKGVQLEDQARKQLLNVAQLPFIFKWVAAMPDVHWGVGATVGSVIPTKGAIIPAAVGVDMGCGMMAVQTSLNARGRSARSHESRRSWRSRRLVRYSRAQPGSMARRVEGPLRGHPGKASEARSRQP